MRNRTIIATAAFFGVAAVGAFTIDAAISHRQHLDAAEAWTRDAAALFAEQTNEVIFAVDQTLKAAALAHGDWLEDEQRTVEAGHRLLRSIHAGSKILAGIGWSDKDGWRRVSSLFPNPKPIRIADQEHFRVHRTRADAGLFIGPPIASRITGEWISPISRRLQGADGQFLGVVTAPLDTSYLSQVHAKIPLSLDARVSVFLADGRYFAGFPGPAHAATAAEYLPLPPDELLAAGSKTFNRVDDASAGDRIVSIEAVKGYPLLVSVGVGRSTALAGWHQRIRVTGAIALLVLFGAVMAGWNLRRQAELLRRQERLAQQSRDEALRANQGKSDFIASMSHEMRTPMNAILGFTELMSREVFGPVGSPKYRGYLRDIEASGQHLLHIINNVLDLAKVEAGKWTMDEDEFALADAADAVVQMLRERAIVAGVALERSNAAPPTRIRADARLIRQILLNLAINGIKFSERGGWVRINWTWTVAGALAVEVSDGGAGMSANDIAEVLKPFGRGSAGRARERHETGLGLSLSKRFAEMHGGTLSISSKPGAGTTVRVVLPRERLLGLAPATPRRAVAIA